MPKTTHPQNATLFAPIDRWRVLVVLLLTATVCLLSGRVVAQDRLSPTLEGQFATTAGLILEKDSPEWYIGQDVYITYRVTNPTPQPVQNATFTYAIAGFVPYDYSLDISGEVSGLIFGAGRVYASYIAPGASMVFYVKCRVTARGSNYFQVFYRIPVSTGGSGQTQGNIYFACYGIEGTPTFSDLAIELQGLEEGLPYAEKTPVSLLVKNQGETTATGVTANFVVPSGSLHATIDSVVTTTGLTQMHNENQVTVSWIIGELPPGQHVRMILTMHPNSYDPFQVETVCVAADIDLVPENNSIETIIPVTGINRDFELETHLMAAAAQTHWGGFVGYLISVTNHGPDEATAITVRTPGKDHRFSYKILNENWTPGPQPQTLSYLRRLPPGQTAVYAYLDMIEPGETGNSAPNEKTVTCTVETPWAEDNMANNTAAATVRFASQPSPAATDLILMPAAIPAAGYYDQILTFTYMLQNNGSSSVSDAYAGIYLPGTGRVVNVRCERGGVIGSEEYAQLSGVNLAPGEQIPVHFDTMPTTSGLMSVYAGAASGTFDVAVGNNYFAGSLPVFVISGEDLDLVANLQASSQASYIAGSGRWQISITGNLNVNNGGGFAVPASSIPVRYYLSADETPDRTDTLIKSDEISGAWTGSEMNLPVNINFISAAKSLNLYLIAVIDPDNTIKEVSEANNTASVYLP